ncbi:5-methyltetrahydropteroyltriglutamate--homocysteine S-methyltransferase [Enterococcus sp. LJL98]
METSRQPFRADHVGSFLRPEKLKRAREQYQLQAITQAELTAVEDQAIRELIAKQKAVGLQVVTDGEFRRRWWHLDFIAGIEGMTVYDFVTTAFGIETQAQGSFVSGALRFPQTHPFLSHFQFTQAVAGETVAKQTIPGPNMILLDAVILSKQYHEKPAYASMDTLISDLIEVYQVAIQAFYAAGCRYLQIDDTSWGALFDARFRGRLKEQGVDPDALIERFASITEEVLRVKPKDLTITFHLCKGNFQSHWLYSGSYDAIAQRLLALPFDGFFLEFDDERSGSFESMVHLQNQRLVLGLVTTKTPTLETKAMLKQRIEEASQYVPLNQLCLSPQCGFSSTHEGNKVSEEDQWAKMAVVVETAAEIWGD